MSAASDLNAHLRRISALERIAGLLDWDQGTQMPRRGASQRAEEAGALAGAWHHLMAEPRLAALCDAAEAEGPDARGVVDIAEARRMHARATRIDRRLAADLAQATAEAQAVWEAARAAAAFADFAPALKRVVALKREEAGQLADGGAPYDALLDDHEPGLTAAAAAALFDALRPGLVELRASIAARAAPAPRPTGRFPIEAQLALSRRIGDAFGYDWNAGRLDLAVHPSSTGRLGDVRITTRIDEAEPFYNIFATIHEIGHALYEQGLDPESALTPAGAAASMGVHESQSRLMENQIGRSRAFAEWLYPAMRDALGPFGLAGPEELHRAANAVETGFIRTEADEIHYNLHVMLRFDLERALIAGELAVDDSRGGLERSVRRRLRPQAPRRGPRRPAGRALVRRRLRLFSDLHARQRLRRRTRRRAARRFARHRFAPRRRRPRSGARLAAPAHPPPRPRRGPGAADRRGDRARARPGDPGRGASSQVRRALWPRLSPGAHSGARQAPRCHRPRATRSSATRAQARPVMSASDAE